MRRGSVNKQQSAGSFRGRAGKAHRLNFALPLRGGIRL